MPLDVILASNGLEGRTLIRLSDKVRQIDLKELPKAPVEQFGQLPCLCRTPSERDRDSHITKDGHEERCDVLPHDRPKSVEYDPINRIVLDDASPPGRDLIPTHDCVFSDRRLEDFERIARTPNPKIEMPIARGRSCK
jgi:hypothetical protein